MKQVSNRVGGQQLMLFTFLLFSIYAFVESYQFNPSVSLMPRVAAGITGISVAILLTWQLIPQNKKPDYVSSNRENDDKQKGQEIADNQTQKTEKDARVKQISAIIFFGYVLFGYLIGLLWVSPVVAVVYCRFRGLNWKTSLVVSIVVALIAFAFAVYLNVPIAEGALTGGQVIN